jgi:hypothetical protein
MLPDNVDDVRVDVAIHAVLFCCSLLCSLWLYLVAASNLEIYHKRPNPAGSQTSNLAASIRIFQSAKKSREGADQATLADMIFCARQG